MRNPTPKTLRFSSSLFFWAFLTSSGASAFGSRPPSPTPPSRPRPKPPSTKPPVQNPPSEGEGPDYFEVGRQIDSSYSRSELTRGRAPASHSTDSCVLDSETDTFIEGVGWGIEEAFTEAPQELDYIATSSWDPYDIYPTSSGHHVSLLSQPVCSATAESLRRNMSTTSRAANMPTSSTISRINTFSSRHNSLRAKAQKGDREALGDLKRHWAKFMGCLSYVESLSDPDVPRSDKLVREYAPSDYQRPRGVNFYYDVGQPIESALNIGLFQFSPGSSGNIQGCIRRWNKFHPTCQVSPRSNNDEMIRILGSSRQAFNSFCGSNAILNTFYIQANTDNSYRTDASNINSNGSMKQPKDRCVSLHVRTGRSYNHFGPFHNSTGSNLDKLMSCVVD